VEALLAPTNGVRLDGIMIGRAAYDDPFLLANLNRRFFGDAHPVPSREAVLDGYVGHMEGCLAEGVPLTRLVKPLFGLYHGVPGARSWRRHLSEEGRKPGAGVEVIRDAVGHVLASAR
jgi:tRNA-dihydrouridine synthase A